MLLISRKGFTLLELIASMAIFLVIMGMMYGTFELVQKQVSVISAENRLTDKGQRLLSFMEEDFRMIGALLGPDARIPYCTGTNTPPTTQNVLVYTAASAVTWPYDSLRFLLSKPVLIKESESCMTGQKDASGVNRVDYYLTTVGEMVAGSTTIDVDAGASCYDDLAVVTDPKNNGKSLITFDSLMLSAAAIAGSAPQVYYPLKSLGTTLTISDDSSNPLQGQSLQQNVPDNSTVYVIRQYEYQVPTGTRNLYRDAWDKSCGHGGDVGVNLIETSDAAGAAGGIDGLRFEFTFVDTITNSLVTLSDLSLPLTQLKSITVWLLLRSDTIDPTYTNTTSYTLGSTASKLVLPAFNDHYRRVLLRKTMEVKNLASIS